MVTVKDFRERENDGQDQEEVFVLVLAQREKQSVPRPERAKKFSATRNERLL